MKTVRTIIAACLAAFITQVSVAQQLTLKQCVEAAISNNLQVRQAEYQSQSDKVNYEQAKGNQLPFIGEVFIMA
jgi:outer membrane protein TolC